MHAIKLWILWFNTCGWSIHSPIQPDILSAHHDTYNFDYPQLFFKSSEEQRFLHTWTLELVWCSLEAGRGRVKPPRYQEGITNRNLRESPNPGTTRLVPKYFFLMCHQQLNAPREILILIEIWNFWCGSGDPYAQINWILQGKLTCILIWWSGEAGTRSTRYEKQWGTL